MSAERIAELEAARSRLVSASAGETIAVTDHNGARVEYRTTRDLARGLAAVDRELAALRGARPAHTIRIAPSKGV